MRDRNNFGQINPDPNHPNGFNAREVSEDPNGTVIVINHPYECNPQDDEEFCWLAYQAEPDKQQPSFIATECRCSLAGEKGYCGEIIGTPEYENGMSKVKSILEGSKCHSLDRHNWRAQNDICGYGYFYPDGWSQGVSEHFKLTHWPYQEKFVNRCMNNMSKNSL